VRIVPSHAVLRPRDEPVFLSPFLVGNFLCCLNAPSTLFPYFRGILCVEVDEVCTPSARLTKGDTKF